MGMLSPEQLCTMCRLVASLGSWLVWSMLSDTFKLNLSAAGFYFFSVAAAVQVILYLVCGVTGLYLIGKSLWFEN